MAITTEVIDKQFVGGTAIFQVKFTDDTQPDATFTKTYRTQLPAPEFLEKIVAEEIRKYDITKAYFETVKIGEVKPFVTPPLTQAQIDANAFFVLLNKLNATRGAMTKELIEADDAGLDALTAQVKAAFKEEYKLDVRWR